MEFVLRLIFGQTLTRSMPYRTNPGGFLVVDSGLLVRPPQPVLSVRLRGLCLWLGWSGWVCYFSLFSSSLDFGEIHLDFFIYWFTLLKKNFYIWNLWHKICLCELNKMIQKQICHQFAWKTGMCEGRLCFLLLVVLCEFAFWDNLFSVSI